MGEKLFIIRALKYRFQFTRILVGLIGSPLRWQTGMDHGVQVVRPVFGGIAALGSWEAFLTALVLAGLFQIAMGYMKAGFIAYFFPTSVITGLLTGIGLLIILKQIPHAFGYDGNPAGELAFFQPDGEKTFSELVNMLD